ncbi:MBL fold metallo-hydrolase [Rhodococcus sp. WS3]|uniref:fumarylacetoacetate hydrolase family protein n=1 Tax=unclassified Rhodococcus (in: high G+C Gram-positive bacteria) TaxID=192944 RepID=UPI0005D38EE4|nr:MULTISPECIES: fumarylacetoacetate hydrolase family protein [unclassified Rhodococcus (in: high G+C Gram-positive bacteria)]KJF19289.1 Ureidoglycolate lyase [Rhodococcus sp. AD45]ROZ42752.1 MBL fold metallo-hydrolase [Rhodococcus sp. WS3]RZL21020.1 MAG: MBL fold metallo-hydrolase [Rhodococcus sp. (in: high G+C Gram-positive bacteria)]
MKWATYEVDGAVRVGVVSGNVIHAAPDGDSLNDLIALGADALRGTGEAALADPSRVDEISAVKLLSPLQPASIRDCLCFLDHMRNVQQVLGSRELSDTWYRVPAFYFACTATVFGPHDDVPMAPGSAWQDFELEIAAVVGAAGADLTIEEAQEAIIGYTILNDWSARDLQQFDSQLGIGQSKGKDSGVTLGPFLVTPDELETRSADGRLDLKVTALVNDEVIGRGTTQGMDWTFAEVISYASRGVPLQAGDVFGSGTVPTCTLVEQLSLANPSSFRGWLRDGDVVTLQVEALGETRQTTRSAPAPHPLPTRVKPGAKPVQHINTAPTSMPFTKGLHEVGKGLWAWLQPNGGYGLSNSGLVVGEGESMLIDTLYDLTLTREMLDGMRPITDKAPIRRLMLTHSNGDHTHGNQLLSADVEIIAASATAVEISKEMPPAMYAMLQTADLSPTATPYFRDRFESFNFGGIELRNADRTFDDRLTVELGGRTVHILNLGPAHTAADSVVHVPDADVLFAGDLLFIGCTPIVWEGPISNWIAACDKMLELDASTVVPGHGPVTDGDGIREVKSYFEYVVAETDAGFAKGLTYQETAESFDLGEYAHWLDSERIVVNVYQRYREIDPETPEMPTMALTLQQTDWYAMRH